MENKTIHLDRIAATRGWKDELQFQLWDEYMVYLPQMPNKQNAQYNEWKILFEKLIDALDDDLILVWHSLGGAFIVKYLSENTVGKKIKKTHILGAPFWSLENENLASFLRKGDLTNLEKQAWELFFYHSKDDFVVPFDHVLQFKKHLPHAQYRFLEDSNHFLWEIVPELNEDITR